MLKFSSKPIAEHAEVPLADDGRWEAIVAQWSERQAPRAPSRDGNDTYVASVGPERDPRVRAAQLAEIVGLVENQGDRVAGSESCHLSSPHPRTFMGKGAARDVAARARASGATMLVVDAELSPSQTRNLEDAAGIPICDREAVILNVFLRHAKTRRAKIQVEIAQLEYLRPRIRGVGLDMDQQTGGMARARGPGETASELLARKLDGRLEELKKGLAKLETSAATQRRKRAACRRVALCGYTNAGKTSLMNALTAAGLSARDVPFETLDTTSRALTRHGADVVISDTVGFIRRLPERLLASFASTLSEAAEASLLAIVVDASDYERDQKLETTLRLVDAIGAGDVPRLYVFNKVDKLESIPDEEEWARLAGGHPWAVVSAHDARSVAGLEAAILRAVRRDEDELAAFVPYAAAPVFALVYGQCRVIESDAAADGIHLRIRGPLPVIGRVRHLLNPSGNGLQSTGKEAK